MCRIHLSLNTKNPQHVAILEMIQNHPSKDATAVVSLLDEYLHIKTAMAGHAPDPQAPAAALLIWQLLQKLAPQAELNTPAVSVPHVVEQTTAAPPEPKPAPAPSLQEQLSAVEQDLENL